MESRFFPPGTIAPVRTPTLFADDAGLARAADEIQALGADGTTPLHDPPLEPRDEAVFLLTAAAEVEHALMVQYLYAAYSVRVRGPNAAELQKVQDLLLQIAREEMGHLITVQNLLHLVGGPLNLGRDRAPYTSTAAPAPRRPRPSPSSRRWPPRGSGRLPRAARRRRSTPSSPR